MELFSITPIEYTDFVIDFVEGKFGEQRLGQAFWNTFHGTNTYWSAFDPHNLFYESNSVVAITKIIDHYLDNDKHLGDF